MAVGKSISSGDYVGKEQTRRGVEVDNVRYFSRCPFGTYFCCDTVGKKGNRVYAREKLQTIQRYKKEMYNIGIAYPNLRVSVTTALERILFAELELSFYQPTDIICERRANRGDKNTKARELHNCISAVNQKVTSILKEQSNLAIR